MGLCGSFRCGCGITSTPAVSGAINGHLPTINVAGSGEEGDPYDLQLNDSWADAVPKGRVGYAAKTSSQTGITTVVDVTSLSVTWTASADRYYRTSVFLLVDVNYVSGQIVPNAVIADASNNQKQNGKMPVTQITSSNIGLAFSVVETGVSGSVTRKVRIDYGGSAGSIDVNGFTTAPSYILVEDIGP